RDLLLQRYRAAVQCVASLAARKPLRLPLEGVRDLERRLDDLSCRLDRAVRKCGERQARHLDGLAARLEALSPLSVIARGDSLTRKVDEIIRSIEQVQPGDQIETLLPDGRIVSRAEECRAAPLLDNGP